MSLKQRTYEGYGIAKCLDICKKHNLTKQNSDLIVDNPGDLDSHWIVKVK